jgi:hypothetical protein
MQYLLEHYWYVPRAWNENSCRSYTRMSFSVYQKQAEYILIISVWWNTYCTTVVQKRDMGRYNSVISRWNAVLIIARADMAPYKPTYTLRNAIASAVKMLSTVKCTQQYPPKVASDADSCEGVHSRHQRERKEPVPSYCKPARYKWTCLLCA